MHSSNSRTFARRFLSAGAAFGLSGLVHQQNNVRERVLEILSLQNKYGAYDTTLLAQLVIAYKTNGDFLRMIMS